MSPLLVAGAVSPADEAHVPSEASGTRVDEDGDGIPEEVRCDERGVRTVGADGQVRRVVWRLPCRAVAGSGARWWFVSDDLREVAGRTTPEPWGPVPPGPVALEADGEAVWLAAERSVVRWEAGTAGEPVPTFGGVSDLLVVDVDGEGVPDLLLAHPDARLVGVVPAGDTAERSFPVPVRPDHLGVDQEGPWAGDATSVVRLLRRADVPAPVDAPPAEAPPAEAPPTEAPTVSGEPEPVEEPPRATIEGRPLGWSDRPERLDGPRTDLLGLSFPEFAGTGGTLASGRRPSSIQVTGSAGLVAGGLLGPGRGIDGSVAAAAAIEQHTPFGQVWFGLDSAPLLLAAGDTTVWPLGMISVGASAGGPHVRSGPFLTAGLVGAGGGWRAMLQPFEQPSGALHGLEARLAVLVGPTLEGQAPEPVGEASLAWASTFQLGRASGRWSATPISVPPGEPRQGVVVCRRFALAAGAELTTSSTELSWEHVGEDLPYELTGSPAIAASCDTGGRHAGGYASGQTAPWASYRAPLDGGDRALFHMGSASLGAVFGGDVLRVGPVVTAGIWRAGGGLRLAATPFRSRRGVHQGLDLRGEILVPATSSFAGTAAWTVWFDPRRGAIAAAEIDRVER